MTQTSAKRYGLPFVYLVVAAALFGPFLGNTFIMDDEIQVTGNSHIQNLQEWPTYFTSSTMDAGGSEKMGGIYYKPVMTTYYAVVWNLFGSNPIAFRCPLLLLHWGSSVLLFWWLTAFFPLPGAAAAGLIFLVHPLNSEVVAYIADAQDALYFFFGFAALTWMTYVRRKSWLAAGLLVLLGLSLLSKETGALFLVLVPLAAHLFAPSKLRTSALCSLLVGIGYAGARWSAGLTTYKYETLHIQQASWAERLLTVPLILWHYIETFFFPWRISLITDFVLHETSFLGFWLPSLGVLVFLCLLGWIFRRQKKRPERKLAIFATSILILWFGLHSQAILPLDGTYADRWFYLGGVGVLIFMLLAARSLQSRDWKFIGPVLVVVALLAGRTWVRLEDWREPLRLYQREYALHPFDAMMANNIGVEFFRRGDIADSEPYFQSATELNPLWDVAWNNLGAVAQRLRQPERALSLYEKSVSMGTYYLAYENYAGLLCMIGPKDQCREFLQKKALPLFPRNATLRKLAEAELSPKEPGTDTL
jgi:protein O-mannosyl-transferase